MNGGCFVKCKELFAKIDKHFDEYVDVWQEICEIESPTESKISVDAVGNYVINIAKKHGWKIEIHEEKISGNAIAITMNPEAKLPPIVFSAHMDTVHPLGSFGDVPVRRDEKNIYGPGVLDCKSGIVQSLLAMHALKEVGFRERPIILILQSDEEVGSRTSEKRTIKFMCDKAKDAVGFINLEGSSRGYAIIQRKGILYYNFHVKGIEAHASKCATVGANAIAEAAHKIIELEKIKNEDGVTCNCGTINGGSVPNTVPGECHFCVNIRYVNSAEREWIETRVREIADTVYVPGCTTTIEKLGDRVAMEYSERNMKFLNKLNEIFEQNGLTTLKAGKATGGSDAAYVTEAGIPCVDNMAATGGEIHSPDEFAEIESLREQTKRIAAVACCIE